MTEQLEQSTINHQTNTGYQLIKSVTVEKLSHYLS